MADWNQGVIEEFRANGGQVSGPFVGAPMLLLTTTGARSGSPRLIPLMYLEEEGRVFVFASKRGADKHPDWYFNLRANPLVTVERGSETYRAEAVDITGSERDRIYAAQATRYPAFGEYQRDTARTIPVVELVRG